MMNKSIRALFLISFALSSCYTIKQKVGIKKEEYIMDAYKEEKIIYNFASFDMDGNLSYQNKILKFSINVWEERFSLKIENLINYPIYIDLDLSSFVINGKPKAYSNFIKDKTSNIIHPYSFFMISDIDPEIDISNFGQEYSDIINIELKEKTYVESNSPSIYRNILTYSVDKNLDNENVIENKFWIGKILISRNENTDYNIFNNGHTTVRKHQYLTQVKSYKEVPVYMNKVKPNWRLITLGTVVIGIIVGIVLLVKI